MTSPILDDEGKIVGDAPFDNPEDDEKKRLGIMEQSRENFPTFAVTRSDFVRLLRGDTLTYGPLRRTISIQDGPFTIIEGGAEPKKILPPDPDEFRQSEAEVMRAEYVYAQIKAEMEDGGPSLNERIRGVLQSFVDKVQGVFRGGPGSGFEGHRGRPGEVGGSLPRGAKRMTRERARELVKPYKTITDAAHALEKMREAGEHDTEAFQEFAEAVRVAKEAMEIDWMNVPDETIEMHEVERRPLTKTAINDFIKWSSSRYNEWRKSDVVAHALELLKNGQDKHGRTKIVYTTGGYTPSSAMTGSDYLINGEEGYIATGVGDTQMPDEFVEHERIYFGPPRMVKRGGPGSGHHGHEGRPGEVGGSLPSGAVAEAEKIGKGGGFLNTLKKLKNSLTPKMEVSRNSTDPNLWFDLYQTRTEWKDKQGHILASIIFHAEDYFPGGNLFEYETVINEDVDHDKLKTLQDELKEKTASRYVEDFLEDVRILLDERMGGSRDDLRDYLGMSEDDFEALAALDRHAVHDTVMQKVIEEVIRTRRASNLPDVLKLIPSMRHGRDDPASLAEDSLMPSEFLRDLYADTAGEGEPRYMPTAVGRLKDFLTTWFNENTPTPTNGEIMEHYGGLPTRTYSMLGNEKVPPGEPTFPDNKGLFVGVRDGEPVSIMETTVVDAKTSFRTYLSVNEALTIANLAEIGVDYEKDVNGKKYLYVDYLASKYPGNGYGTEMMLKALGIAGENGWGLAGESISSSKGYYEMLGAKWADTSGFDGSSRLGFWTPDDVGRAYKVLNMIGAGAVLESKALVERGFNLLALADLYDPAALMSRDADIEGVERRIIETMNDFWKRNYPPEEEVIVVRGLLRRVYIEKGGKGSGHHGHEGREGEVGGSKPSGSAGAPRPGRVAEREKEIEQSKEAAAAQKEGTQTAEQKKVAPAPPNEQVYPPKDSNGNRVPYGYVPADQQFQWNDSLELVGQIPFEEKKTFLDGLPKDTREMTADQRWDLAKVMLDLPAEKLFEYEKRLKENLPNIRNTGEGTSEHNQALQLTGIRDVVYGAASYLRQMQAGAKNLESDDVQSQGLGRSLISNAQYQFEFDVMGVWHWTDEDQEAYRSEWASTLPHNQAEQKSLATRGGAGSGHHGHRGRPGEIGGSLPEGTGAAVGPDDLDNFIDLALRRNYDVMRLSDEKYWKSLRGQWLANYLYEKRDMGMDEAVEWLDGLHKRERTRIVDDLEQMHLGYLEGQDFDNAMSYIQGNLPVGYEKAIAVYSEMTERGGPGSGHRGHKGRPDEVGGSLPGEGGGSGKQVESEGEAGMAEGEEGEQAEGGEGDQPVEETPAEVMGVIIKVGEESIQFDSQEQYQKVRELAQGIYQSGVDREPELTTLVSDLASKHGGDMSGLEFKIKSEDSIVSKIRRKMVEDGLTEEDAAARMNDVNRYTMLFTPDIYVERVKAVQNDLTEAGWHQYDSKWKNYWVSGDDYDGYNTIMTNDAGDRFELQYHTYESIAIKQRSHQIYLQLRSMPEHMKEQKLPLWQEMVGLWDTPYEKPVNFEMLEGVS